MNSEFRNIFQVNSHGFSDRNCSESGWVDCSFSHFFNKTSKGKLYFLKHAIMAYFYAILESDKSFNKCVTKIKLCVFLFAFDYYFLQCQLFLP
jgi:hypothetical protein